MEKRKDENTKDEKKSILVVDDNPQNIQLVATHLKSEGYRIAFSQHGVDALEKTAHKVFDLVLLDVMMPEIDGFEVCRRIKGRPDYRDVPILFLTAKTDKESIIEGFNAGAVDYVVKPFYGAELLARVRTHLQIRSFQEKLENINAKLNRELEKSKEMTEELSEAKEELQKANTQLYEKATRDPLTGLFNRRKMIDSLEYETKRTERGDTSYSLVLCDIDHFKTINDSHGHDCGDVILKEVAEILKSTTRKQDRISRWGGEEFLILLPETEEPGALTLADKIRKTVEEKDFSCPELSIKLSMTFGVSVSSGEKDPESCIKEADIALYNGKNNGRNRVVAYRKELKVEK
ncbi:MAG: diguanylate cyclase [Spirochaetaceae bacterium]